MSKYSGAGKNAGYTAMVNSGMDAFGNLYDVKISFPTEIGETGTAEVMTVRCKSDWTPPAADMETYDITYRGTKQKRLKPSYNFERTLSATFRVDAEYNILSKFKKWKGMCVNAETGLMVPWPSALGSIELQSVDFSKLKATADSITDGNNTEFKNIITENTGAIGSSGYGRYYKFDEVWISKVSEVKFGNDATEPQEVEVTFEFGNVTYPENIA